MDQENQEEVLNRRKLAQELYYGKKTQGASPLVRSIAALQEECFKQPVHQRLGVKKDKKKIILRRTRNNLNTGVSNRTPLQLRRTNTRNGTNLARTYIRRRHSAQYRLTRIRQQHSLENLVQGLNNNQKIKLRRTRRPLTQQEPTNYLVQVPNTSYRNQQTVGHHSVRSSIDPLTQSQIRVLQSQINFNSAINIPLPEPLFVAGVGKTHISLHDRFSRLP